MWGGAFEEVGVGRWVWERWCGEDGVGGGSWVWVWGGGCGYGEVGVAVWR